MRHPKAAARPQMAFVGGLFVKRREAERKEVLYDLFREADERQEGRLTVEQVK